ncbi:hypothetical protein [Modestobacter versicolor]|uniref:Uncharacterized protein n=1 Tax=Modestobacter versicolor TaxID=429133 RepID=A0A323VIL1_9ACTN|nr:hypothetical protein [Modestobacter versicolor]MBB3676950.1 hypothetical protein [Modestobacter versicolor]PZA22866.1 hypothetical protein DMO24_02695 [Modestobacter versicolor]
MNDTDLTAALHRDADLVGDPSPHLLEQLTRRREHQRRQRAGLLAATLGVVVIAAGIPLGGALMNSSDGGPATDPVAPTPSISTPAPPPPAAPTTVQAQPPSVVVTPPVEAPATSSPAAPSATSSAVSACLDDESIRAALPPLDGGYTFDLSTSRAPVCVAQWAVTFPVLLLHGELAPAGEEAAPTLLEDVDGVWTWVYPDQLCVDGSLPAIVSDEVCSYY